AASGTPTPVRTPRCERPMHLRRSGLEADHGADRRREYKRGLASVAGTGRAVRARIMPAAISDSAFPHGEARLNAPVGARELPEPQSMMVGSPSTDTRVGGRDYEFMT